MHSFTEVVFTVFRGDIDDYIFGDEDSGPSAR